MLQTAFGRLLVVSGFSCIKRIFSLHQARSDDAKKIGATLSHPSESLERKLPAGIGDNEQAPGVAEIFKKERRHTLPCGGILTGKGHIIAVPSAVVLEGGVLLYEPSRQIAKDIYQQPVIRRRRLHAELEANRVFHAAFDHGSTFYHWLYDILPLLLLPPFREELERKPCKVVLPPLCHPFQTESLRMAGLEGLDIITTNTFDCLHANEVIVPILPQTTGHQHPAVIKALRSNLLPPDAWDTPADRRIFISRKNATRGLANEAEILELLANHGVEPVVLEDLPFIDQIRLFARSSLVVAPHGAGLSHLVFMPRGGKVIELFSRQFINPCYWRLACACSHDYTLLTGDPVGSTARPEHDNYRIEAHLLKVLANSWDGRV